jgi:hypothetical protein
LKTFKEEEPKRKGWNKRNLNLNMNYSNCDQSIKDRELDGWR